LTGEFSDYTSVSQALRSISEATKPRPRIESVSVRNAYGRVAAEEVVSPINVPDVSRSHMDGYAVVASDLKGSSPHSPMILRLAAGGVPRISSGETMKVATGGVLPAGANAVVPVEEARKIGHGVLFNTEHREGDFCFSRGADVRKGSRVLRRGATIRAQDIGLLVLLGRATVKVYAKPRVALLPTGSELTDALGAVGGSMVRESHTPIFENLISASGGAPARLGIIPDDVGRIATRVEQALQVSDLVFTLGGTSLGEKDLVEQALRRVSRNSRIIHGIKMDRGRVAGVAEVKGKPLVMLPGPVQGALNAFLLLGIPLIDRLAGRKESALPALTARLAKGWTARRKFAKFTKVLYVSLSMKGGEFVARPLVRETESMTILTDSDGFVVVPEKTVELRAGTRVSVRLLPGFSYVAGRFLT